MAIDPAAHAHVKNAAMQPHQQFKLSRGRLAAMVQPPVPATLAHQSGKQFFPQHREITLGDVSVTQARKNEHTNPVTLQDHPGIFHIEAGELGLDIQGFVVQHGFPFGAPAAFEQIGINTLDQGLLRREIVVQQGMRDTQPAGQIS